MRRTIAAVCLAVVGFVAGGCSGDDGGSSDPADATTSSSSSAAEGISEDEAISAAMDAMRERSPDFDFDATYPVVIDLGAEFDVSFPSRDVVGFGSEHHVMVDKTTGAVNRIIRRG